MEDQAIKRGANPVRRFVNALCVCTLLIACMPATHARARTIKTNPPQRDSALMHLVLLAIDDLTLDTSELRKITNLTRSRTQDEQIMGTALLARYHRIVKADPQTAIELTAPFVLGREAVEEWKKKRRLEKSALLQKRSTARTIEERDRIGTTVPFSFPPVSQWQTAPAVADCVIEACQALIALNAYQQVSTAVKQLGVNSTSTEQVLAAETGGDLLLAIGTYDRAIEFYKHALKLLSELAFDEYGYRRDDFVKTPLHRYFHSRIQVSLDEAQRLLEMEKYGKGYVLYRDAEALRRKSRSHIEAIMAYRRIVEECPKTIYAEAATAYTLKCRLALTLPEHRKKAAATLEGSKQALDDRRRRIAQIKYAGAASKVIEELQEAYDADRATWEEMAAIIAMRPAEAFDEVRALGREMLAANKFGPYRGEVLLDFATFALNVEMDSKRAFELYSTAWKWLKAVDRADANIAGLSVPAKARSVSAPPREEKQVSFWGKVTTREPEIGTIVNRQTCSWYLDDLREQCALSLGFLHFYRGETDEAIRWYALAPTLDPVTGDLESGGEWNNYRRLKWGAEHGYLYAYPEELKMFTERQRFAVLLADFYYCSERFQEARKLAERLLAGDYGRLSPRCRAYPYILIGSCMYRTAGRKPAFLAFESAIREARSGFSVDRAALMAANVSAQITDLTLHHRGHEYLKKLAYSTRRNTFVYDAKIEYGLRMFHVGNDKEGEAMLRSMPVVSGGYRELAMFYLEEEKAKKEKARNHEG